MMFQRQVRLKQAQNAFRDGRLDEAFSIATEKEIRDLRGAQVLLERLVRPLLERAERHLAAGRARDALLDLERALAAGGRRSEALDLKARIEAALNAERQEARDHAAVLDSVKGHLENGSLAAGRERLGAAPLHDPRAAGLHRELENRERRLAEARERTAAHLERGEILEALAALEEAAGAAGRRDARDDLLSRLKRAATERLERALAQGELVAASDLARRLSAAAGESLETRRFDEALDLASRSALRLTRGDYEGARVALSRLQALLPEARWVGEHLAETVKVAEGLRILLSGPLAALASGREGAAGAGARAGTAGAGKAGAGEATRVRAPALAAPAQRPDHHHGGAAADDRFLLWIDGVGTYLVLTADRASLGRGGSSARPDVGLAADLAGYHAEILRADHDYFIVAGQGAVAVGGQPTERKLLADGDSLELAPRCRLSFRLPSPLSTSAVLALGNGQRLENDVREVILMDEHFLVGRGEKCHVATRGGSEPLVLSRRGRDLICRAKEEVLVAGTPAGCEAAVPLGALVQVGDLTFTVTPAPGAPTPLNGRS
jgi:hypothetical protein